MCAYRFYPCGYCYNVPNDCKGGVVLNDATCGKVKSCLDCPYPNVPSKCLDYVNLPTGCGAKSGVRVAIEEKEIKLAQRYDLGHGFEWSAVYNKNYNRLSIVMYHKRQFVATLDIGDTHTETSASVSVKVAPGLSLARYIRLSGTVMSVNYALYNQLLALAKPGHLLKYTKGQMSINEFHAICDDLREKGALEIA